MLLRATALVLLFSGTAALAAEPQVYRLTPEQIETAKAAGAQRPESPSLLPSPERDAILGNSLYANPDSDESVRRQIHGEAGFFVGTGGTRGFFGSALIPLGQNGSLSLSFQNSQLPGYGHGYGPNAYRGFGRPF